MENILRTEAGYSLLMKMLKRILLQRLFSKGPNYFVAANDSAAATLFTDEVYQAEVVSVIKMRASKMRRPFLLDIGANVGLISCQVASSFEVIELFEPNKQLCHIIRANLMSIAPPVSYVLHEFALGDSSRDSHLRIPPKNLGGAFIHDDKNSYSNDILGEKDGNSKSSFERYRSIEIEMKDAEGILREVFTGLKLRGFNQGVIKIDTEGYELVILRAMGRALPRGMNVSIIFESWDCNLSNSLLRDLIPLQASYSIVKTVMPYNRSDHKSIKFLKLLFAPTVSSRILGLTEGDSRGEIIVDITT